MWYPPAKEATFISYGGIIHIRYKGRRWFLPLSLPTQAPLYLCWFILYIYPFWKAIGKRRSFAFLLPECIQQSKDSPRIVPSLYRTVFGAIRLLPCTKRQLSGRRIGVRTGFIIAFINLTTFYPKVNENKLPQLHKHKAFLRALMRTSAFERWDAWW